MKTRNLLLVLGTSALCACTANTSLRSTDPQTRVAIRDNAPLVLNAPVKKTYNATSFGQFPFQASNANGEPMYGLVPLKFNGGYLAADILFFAPAMFYNLREVYPIYEFDVAQNVVRYKKAESDQWMTYTPTAAEAQRAKEYFVK